MVDASSPSGSDAIATAPVSAPRDGCTPGPWTIEAFDSFGQGEWHGWTIKGAQGTVITSIGAADQRGPVDMDSNYANVCLIAAAPDLLCALVEMLDHAAVERFSVGAEKRARAAVRKAICDAPTSARSAATEFDNEGASTQKDES